MLHSVFDELINFVEIELAWMQVVFSDEDRRKHKTPWYRTFFRFNTWRCPEAGIAYLKWASDLKADENWIDKSDPRYGQPTNQALAAQEIFTLYEWWKHTRPNRPDPSIASGWAKYCEEKCNSGDIIGDSSLDEEQSRKILNLNEQLETEQFEEDTTMLIRLIKIRRSLWT